VDGMGEVAVVRREEKRGAEGWSGAKLRRDGRESRDRGGGRGTEGGREGGKEGGREGGREEGKEGIRRPSGRICATKKSVTRILLSPSEDMLPPTRTSLKWSTFLLSAPPSLLPPPHPGPFSPLSPTRPPPPEDSGQTRVDQTFQDSLPASAHGHVEQVLVFDRETYSPSSRSGWDHLHFPLWHWARRLDGPTPYALPAPGTAKDQLLRRPTVQQEADLLRSQR
jgi:hypothetical protein